MIPFAIFYMKFHLPQKKLLEVRALEMAPDFFSFRLNRRQAGQMKEKVPAAFGFYAWKEQAYHHLVLQPDQYELRIESVEEFYTLFRLTSHDHNFMEESRRLMSEYMSYIHLKLEEDDPEISRQLTGYPVDERRISASFDVQKKMWAETAEKWPGFFSGKAGKELGIEIQGRQAEDHFLAMEFPDFLVWYQKERMWGKSVEVLQAETITHLYFGSQFCSRLYPEGQIVKLLDKCLLLGKIPAIQFSPMDEEDVSVFRKRLQKLKHWSGEKMMPEITVNDPGLLFMLRDEFNESFQITAGVLLMKRRKDTRLPWKAGWKEAAEAAVTADAVSMDDPLVEGIFKKLSVSGLSYENAGYPQKINGEVQRRILYYPYFQTNTSTWCPLYANICNGFRGRQERVESCPQYCQSAAFLYPDQLHMAGMMNSLFGWSAAAPDLTKFDRVVLNYL